MSIIKLQGKKENLHTPHNCFSSTCILTDDISLLLLSILDIPFLYCMKHIFKSHVMHSQKERSQSILMNYIET